ncbi:transposase [Sphingomonas sp. HMP9]|nr:transposase [Sphingomonas sp. HMP9]
MSDLYWLTDEQMARLEPYFPKSHGKSRVDDWRGSSGIVFVNRNGLRGCDAPKEYGPHKTLFNRWKRWGRKGHIPSHEGGVGGRERHAEDDHDRRDLPEGTPHGIEPAG